MKITFTDLMSEIKKSKKYRQVYQPFLERVCAEESLKYKKDKDIIKAAKNRLHTAYGAFFGENGVKSAELILKENSDAEKTSERLMRLNASSNERISFISELYKFIFGIVLTGPGSSCRDISTILDIGCGFNPFCLPFMLKSLPELSIKSYYAFDIDINLAETINKYFGSLNLPKYAGCMDIISEIPAQKADIAFLFKIIPTIENCRKGRGFEIINSLNVKYAVVSFPTKTLCGKNKGMAENYTAFFEKNLDYNKFTVSGKNIFENELVYILSRKP